MCYACIYNRINYCENCILEHWTLNTEHWASRAMDFYSSVIDMPDNGKWLVLFDALNVLAFWLCRISNQSIHWILSYSLSLPHSTTRKHPFLAFYFCVCLISGFKNIKFPINIHQRFAYLIWLMTVQMKQAFVNQCHQFSFSKT